MPAVLAGTVTSTLGAGSPSKCRREPAPRSAGPDVGGARRPASARRQTVTLAPVVSSMIRRSGAGSVPVTRMTWPIVWFRAASGSRQGGAVVPPHREVVAGSQAGGHQETERGADPVHQAAACDVVEDILEDPEPDDQQRADRHHGAEAEDRDEVDAPGVQSVAGRARARLPAEGAPGEPPDRAADHQRTDPAQQERARPLNRPAASPPWRGRR